MARMKRGLEGGGGGRLGAGGEGSSGRHAPKGISLGVAPAVPAAIRRAQQADELAIHSGLTSDSEVDSTRPPPLHLQSRICARMQCRACARAQHAGARARARVYVRARVRVRFSAFVAVHVVCACARHTLIPC